MSTDPASTPAPVAIIIPCYRQAHLLGEALASCAAQAPPAAEVVVVDDGSPDDVAAAVAPFRDRLPLRLVRRSNGGLSAARNTGIAESESPFLIFLDADDRLCPGAIAAGLGCLAANPDAAFAWGGYRNIDLDGRPYGDPSLPAPGPEPRLDLLGGNVIGMHATVIYRRPPLAAAGGFAEGLRACEDWDVYLRLAETHPLACHRHVTAEYRRHAGGMSRDFIRLIDAGLAVLERHRPGADEPRARHRAWRRGRLQLVGLNLKRAVVAGLRAAARGDLKEARAATRTVARYLGILLTLGSVRAGPRPAAFATNGATAKAIGSTATLRERT
jgi:glycosyltransferase involved in cell wall biosynthesis